MSKIDTNDFISLRYSVASEAVGTTWPFKDFVRIHGEYKSVVVADKEYGIFEDANNNKIVTCVSNVVKKYGSKEFENNKVNLEVVVLESGLYCVCEKWEDVNLGEQAKNSWGLLEFAKAHGKMQVGDFKDKNTGEVFKACIFTKPDGTRTFVAFASATGELTPQQIAAMKNELVVVQLESGNYSLCKKRENSWDDVDFGDDEQNSSPKHAKSQDTDVPKVAGQPSAKEKKKNNWLDLGDMKRETLEPYESIRTSTEIKEWPTSTNKGKVVRPPKETKPTSSHYVAVVIDMVIAIAVGICVYNSSMIHLKQDRMLFLVTCFALSVLAWGYPYFDTSVKINNDGCFAQGCIHPIIGVFGILFFPLFIHYWMYKGIKICIILVKRYCGNSSIIK